MRKSILVIIFYLCSLTISPYLHFLYAQSIELQQVKNGNLELHVVTDENVDIKVFIDNKLAVSERFNKQKEEDNIGIAPHKVFKFNLSSGKHTLQAEANQGKQSFVGEFEISNKRWVSLSYVDPQRINTDKPFSLEVYDYQIMYQ